MDGLKAPVSGGKRPRSPVDKLADLQHADDDEANWRSSKRYFTEVISNGFSKLNFSRGLHAQQQGAAQQASQQQCGSPKAHHVQVPSGMLSPREQSDCEMDMQESPTWPPRSNSPGSHSNRLNKAPNLMETFNGLTSPPGAASPSAMQFPFGGYCAPSVRAPQPSGTVPSPYSTAAGVAGPPVLPPKVLKAVEKPPNSPSDLPGVGGNLRKVALLRALLVRTEQHLQHQQEQALEQQHDMHHHHQQQYQHTHNAEITAQTHQQQHCPEAAGQNDNSSSMADTAKAAPGYPCTAAEQSTCSHNSDDMDCGSMSDSPSSTPHLITVAGPGVLADPATNSLLCSEVMAQHSSHVYGPQQQHQTQPQHPNWAVNAPNIQHPMQPPGQLAAHHQQQHQTLQPQAPPPALQLRQLHQPRHTHMLPPRAKLKSPELSADQVEALRAKALASTSTLTHLEPEDLHSLQMSISAGQCRRGSDHSHVHSTLAPAVACRRHSSHI